MLELYALVSKIHLVQSHLPLHERVKVVVKLGVFDFDGVFHEAAKVTQLARRSPSAEFPWRKGEANKPPNPNKIPPGSAVYSRYSKRFAWNRQLASVTFPLVLRCCVNWTKPERQQPMPNN